MIAMRFLAEMAVHIALDFIQRSPTDVAQFHPAGTRHFVAAVRFDKLLVALWTGPHFGFAERLFDLESSLVLSIIFDDFFAS